MKRLPTLTPIVLAGLVLASGIVGAVATASSTTATDTDRFDRTTSDHTDDRSEHDPADRRELRRAVADELGLTDDQQEELRETVTEMRADGAARSEIRRAVGEQLDTWGHDRSDLRSTAREVRVTHRMSAHFDITDEQADDLYDEIRRLRADGANASEIREAVTETLDSDGLNDAEIRHAIEHIEHAAKDNRLHRVMGLQERFDLTDEEMDEITETISSLKADGASPSEIRQAVKDDLESFGVDTSDLGERPRPPTNGPHPGNGHGPNGQGPVGPNAPAPSPDRPADE